MDINEDDDDFLRELEGDGDDDFSARRSVSTLRDALNRSDRIYEPSSRPGEFSALPRPGDLSDPQKLELLDLLRIQTPERDACFAVGLDPSVFARWMKTAESDPECRDFRMDVEQAISQGIAHQTRQVFNGQDRIASARWMLERRRPAAFGQVPSVGVSVSATVGRPLSSTEEGQASVLIDVLTSAGVSLPDDIQRLVGGERLLGESESERILEAESVESSSSSPDSGPE